MFKKLMQLNNGETKSTWFKNEHKNWIDIFPKKIYRLQQVHEKILNITNKSYNEILSHSCQNGSYKKDKK